MSLTRWKSSPGGHCANRTGTGPDMLGNIKFFIKLGQNVLNKLSVVVNWGILTETHRHHMVFRGSSPWPKNVNCRWHSRLLPMKKLVEKSDWNVNRLLALHWNLPSRANSDSCFRNILQRHVQHTRRINPMQIQLSNLPKSLMSYCLRPGLRPTYQQPHPQTFQMFFLWIRVFAHELL